MTKKEDFQFFQASFYYLREIDTWSDSSEVIQYIKFLLWSLWFNKYKQIVYLVVDFFMCDLEDWKLTLIERLVWNELQNVPYQSLKIDMVDFLGSFFQLFLPDEPSLVWQKRKDKLGFDELNASLESPKFRTTVESFKLL